MSSSERNSSLLYITKNVMVYGINRGFGKRLFIRISWVMTENAAPLSQPQKLISNRYFYKPLPVVQMKVVRNTSWTTHYKQLIKILQLSQYMCPRFSLASQRWNSNVQVLALLFHFAGSEERISWLRS